MAIILDTDLDDLDLDAEQLKGDQECNHTYGKYSKLLDAAKVCKQDNNCLYIINTNCNKKEFQLCHKNSSITTSDDGSCLWEIGNNCYNYKSIIE